MAECCAERPNNISSVRLTEVTRLLREDGGTAEVWLDENHQKE